MNEPTYEKQNVKSESPDPKSNSNTEPQRNTVLALKVLASRLMREVESLNEVHSLDIHSGIDFYDEVTEFEIGLIRRALTHTRGHQGRAARLLNLKVTTLNSKIKQYKIKLEAFASGYPLIDPSDMEIRQHV